MNKTSYVRRESWLQEVNRLTFLTDRILTDVPFKNITVIAKKTVMFLGWLLPLWVRSLWLYFFSLLLSCAEMPRCQGWSEDYDPDSWPISDARLHARNLKTSCHPCSHIPVVWTLVQSFTYLTELYSNMLNWVRRAVGSTMDPVHSKQSINIHPLPAVW